MQVRSRCSGAIRLLVVPVLVAFLSGCGGADGPQVAPVRGVVTLDNQPLAEALVEFVPEEGRPANGVTNAKGEYELIYSQSEKGAAVGKHTVKITIGREAAMNEGVQTQAAVTEKVPAKYNTASQLTEHVEPGKNEIDFALQSK